MPRKNKPEPWEGGSSDDNDWEPEENLDGDLMSFEKKNGDETNKSTSEALDEGQAFRKRGRRDKKKKIEEIEKPRGVDRGLQPERILAAQLYNSSVFFLVKWQDCLDLDVVPGKDLNLHFPEFVIQYYESCMPLSVRHKAGRIPRIAPELPPEAIPEVPMDVSENLEPPPMPSLEQPADQSMPDTSMADVSMPQMSMPPMSLPPMSMPDMSLPPMSMTDVTMPPMSMPDMSMPSMSMPDMSMPPMSMPDMSNISMPSLPMPDVSDQEATHITQPI